MWHFYLFLFFKSFVENSAGDCIRVLNLKVSQIRAGRLQVSRKPSTRFGLGYPNSSWYWGRKNYGWLFFLGRFHIIESNVSLWSWSSKWRYSSSSQAGLEYIPEFNLNVGIPVYNTRKPNNSSPGIFTSTTSKISGFHNTSWNINYIFP